MTEPPTRTEPSRTGDERTQLTGFLDFLRQSVVWKASGLTDDQAHRALVPSPLTTIAGLVAHLTFVEQRWFEVVLAGRPDPWRAALAADPDAEFRAARGKPVADLIREYERQCALSRDILGNFAFTDEVTTTKGEPLTVRWIVAHMVEETGRHAGHLDILRELTDGLTGE